MERTRRAGEGQLDLTALLPARGGAPSEPVAQQRMAAGAATLEPLLGDPDAARWAQSPYRWIRELATARKSKAAERLVAAYLADDGILVAPATGSGCSFVVGGSRVKVRMSMRWGTGEFVFQQIHVGEYDQLCLVGISPETMSLWLVERADLVANTDPGSGWLSFPADDPPAWMVPAGGPVTAAAQRFRNLT